MTSQPVISDPVLAYAEGVLNGEIIAGPHVRDTCARHMRDLENGEARGLRWDADAAARALGFFPDILRLSEGQFDGLPFTLHPSQAFIVGSLFGWKRADGTRRFRRAYIEQGKGNGKSPLAGGIGLYGMMADSEPGAQVYAAAAKMDQARILFQDAVNMVRQSPALDARITPSGVNPVFNLADRGTGSFFRPLGRDTGKTGSGLRPHFVLVDELHEHPDRGTLELLERGFKFRRQPLVLMITNSGSDRTSVCWEEHDLAVKVAAGDIEDDTTFSYVCALDEGDDPLEDPSCWPKANPLLGVTITESLLEDVVAQARGAPGRANGIRRLHFCQWTDSEVAWLERDVLAACEDETLSLTDFEGEECWVGLDLSAARDMTAYALLFRDGFTEDGKPKFALFGHAYLPRDTIADRVRGHELNEHVPVWIEQGWITTTKGRLVHHGVVARDIVDLGDRFAIVTLAYDVYLYDRFSEALDDMGAVLPVMEHPQTFNRRKNSDLWMPQSLNDFEELILENRIRIQPNPAMRAAIMGAMLEESVAGLRRLTKQKSTERIDLAVASIMAAGAAMGQQVAQPMVRYL